MKMMPVLVLVFFTSGCSSLKPILRTAHDVAKSMCGLHFGTQQGLSAEEAAEKFCDTEEKLRPWIDLVLSAQKNGVTPDGQLRGDD